MEVSVDLQIFSPGRYIFFHWTYRWNKFQGFPSSCWLIQMVQSGPKWWNPPSDTQTTRWASKTANPVPLVPSFLTASVYQPVEHNLFRKVCPLIPHIHEQCLRSPPGILSSLLFHLCHTDLRANFCSFFYLFPCEVWKNDQLFPEGNTQPPLGARQH